MLELFAELLRKILLDNVAGLRSLPVGQPPPAVVSENQVRFQPPDERWRTHVRNLQRNALNVYLVDLRENTQLRSNERRLSMQDGLFASTPDPARMDCHYLISAQSPAEISEQVEPAIDEHVLLYQAAAALFQHAPFCPAHIYPPGSAALAAWGDYAQDELPARVLPNDGFEKLAEFWGVMDGNRRWKPVVYLIVTVPVALRSAIAGPPVTTRITEYRFMDSSEPGETWFQIGGTVTNRRSHPVVAQGPLAGARVTLETQAGAPIETMETNALGRFTFSLRAGGNYRLHCWANGLGELAPRNIQIPSPTGEYELTYV